MIKMGVELKAVVPLEDVRRALNLPPHYTIRATKQVDDKLEFILESPMSVGVAPTRVTDLTAILGIIQKAINSNKEIVFEYYNEKRDAIEITNRKFSPTTWINNDCIEGHDHDKNAVRRFCPSRMNWVESV